MRQVCAVLDLASRLYGQPMFVVAIGVAVRSFVDEVNRKGEPEQAPLYHHPEDFELWLLSQYDEETGKFSEPDGGVRVLARGADVHNGGT